MTPEDIARYRAETQGVKHVLHFNNAGSSLTPDPVHNTVVAHLERERQIGGYEAKDEAASRMQAFYSEASGLIGAAPDEIAYVENATRAWDMAFYSLPLKEGDVILTAQAEYSSNYLAYLQMAKRKGVVIEVVPDDNQGQLDVAALKRMITARTRLISITHIPTHGGLINPAAEIGKVARSAGVPFLLDACQSVGQLDVNVEEIGCDMLSATGRKFLRGPRGTGFLYVKRELANRLEPVFVDLHSADWPEDNEYTLAPGALRFENWECYYAGKLGLAEAIRYARSIGLKEIEQRVLGLAKLLREELSKLRGVTLTDTGTRQSGIVTFVKQGHAAETIKMALRAQGINVSVSSGDRARFDLLKRGYHDVVRASVHYYNTEDEIARFIRAIGEFK
ncbi:aminotransferase class V-fold PLP-dependent enzyme [Aestuariivirga sp.]|uniref:aminotransferase class V-fold PLP-dependent enzyme n=1 Tax=Aestuariivirga sp. TaxID=2650926 RepID=UPI0039E6C6D2